MNDYCTELIILGCKFFPFSTLSISCHCTMTCKFVKFLLKILLIILLGFFSMWLVIFSSFAAFKIISLTSAILIVMTWVHLFGALCASCTWMSVSFPRLGKFSAIISSNKSSVPSCVSSPSGTHIMWILGHSMLSQRSLKLSSYKFFLFYCFDWVISNILSSSSFMYYLLSPNLLIPSSKFLNLGVFFSSDWFFAYFLVFC